MLRLVLQRTLVVCFLLAGLLSAADNKTYRVIPGEYLIEFKEGISKAQALKLVAQLSAENQLLLRHTFKSALKGFSAKIPAGKLAVLQAHPAIASIEPNGFLYIHTVDAPINFTVVAPNSTQVDLAWTDIATTEQGFEVERSTTGINGAYSQLQVLIGQNIESFTDNTVTAGQEFCYRVRTGESFTILGPFSTSACATPEVPPPTPPADPTGLALNVVNDQRIDLNWNDNSNNETGFRVERALGVSGTFAQIDVAGANVNTYQSTALNADTEYCYRVQAFNNDGDSAYTLEQCATTQAVAADPLAPPTNFTAVAPNENQIDLSWTDNATTEAGYELLRSTNGINGNYTRLELLIGADITSYTDNAVTTDLEHCYQLRAGESLQVLGNLSASVCATPQSTPPTPPAAPSGLGLNVVNSGRIDLGWADGSTDETGFRVERAPNIGGPFAEIDVVGVNIENYSSTGLTAETQYCYRVQAFNGAGNSTFTTAQCATTAPASTGECVDTGNHDDLTNLYGISITKANQNVTWQASTSQDCEITPWYFGIDTGVDSDHPDLNVQEIMGFIASDPNDPGEDTEGHGTHTAGSAAARDGNGNAVGMAPGAPVFGFKVCMPEGCALDDIVAAVDEVTARKLANPNQPMVANMSLGGGADNFTDTAVRRSVNAGVVYTLSAGNGVLGACLFPGDAQNNSPARVGDDAINAANGSDGNTDPINGAITVTSSDSNDQDVNCNFGAPVTVAAPGEGIFSTWIDGGYATISGTSMAAPHTAGAAILYLMRFPNATPEEVEQAIVNDLDPWTTNESPNASGRLDASGL